MSATMEELKWLRKELTIWREIAEMFYTAGQRRDDYTDLESDELYYKAVDAYLDQFESEYNDDE